MRSNFHGDLTLLSVFLMQQKISVYRFTALTHPSLAKSISAHISSSPKQTPSGMPLSFDSPTFYHYYLHHKGDMIGTPSRCLSKICWCIMCYAFALLTCLLINQQRQKTGHHWCSHCPQCWLRSTNFWSVMMHHTQKIISSLWWATNQSPSLCEGIPTFAASMP
jgi:hypothetical protein